MKSRRWLLFIAVAGQLASFGLFWLVTLLADPEALTSSIYTYYQSQYYVHLSAGKIPWIHFNVEYPPLAVYSLLFPAYASGLSVLAVSLLRAMVSASATALVLRQIVQSETVSDRVKLGVVTLTTVLSCVTPGYYHGLFDWTMFLANLGLPLSLVAAQDKKLTSKLTWWIIWLGSSIKLLPLLAAPFLAVGKQTSRRLDWLAPFLVTALIHVPFVIWGFEGMRYFVAYHRLRGIDCFSIYSTFLLTAEKLGGTAVEVDWRYGAPEVLTPIAQNIAKLSLPLFVVVVIGLLLRARRKSTQQSIGLYCIALLLYPAISKVAQHNYVVWSISAIAALWLLGFNSPTFMKRTGAGALALIGIGWVQNAAFATYLESEASWISLIAAWLRFAVLIVISIYALKEIERRNDTPLSVA